MFREMIETLTEARRLAAFRRRKKAHQDAKFNAALAFNNLHTYSVGSRAEWMCPICNAIHPTTGSTVWTGRQFPACCDFQAGHRQYKICGFTKAHDWRGLADSPQGVK